MPKIFNQFCWPVELLLISFCNLCSKPKCRLVATHDDYSLMSMLPREKTSVMTVLRHPVERVFSAYEFAVEVAARFLVHPNLTSAKEMTKRLRAKNMGVSTLDIWPWKYLVPWMREDLFARVVFLLCFFFLPFKLSNATEFVLLIMITSDHRLSWLSRHLDFFFLFRPIILGLLGDIIFCTK